jgi:subtilisin family serine protease
MKLRYGSGGDFIYLEHMPIRRAKEKSGRRVFEPERLVAGRAAFLANRVVARTFQKTFAGEAERAKQVGIDDDRVRVAVYRDGTGKHRVVYREAIVRFRPDVSLKTRRALLAKYKLRVREVDPYAPDQVVVYDPRRKYIAESVLDLTNELNATGDLSYAYPNFVSEFKRASVPTPHEDQWHLGAIEARRAWRTTRGQGVTIAILDDGVDVDHPALKGNILRRPDPRQRRDLYGRDFFIDESKDSSGELETFDPRPKIFRYPFNDSDINDNHGTSCAGVAAASGKGGNVFGIAPRARILPVKIFHGDGMATEKQVARAIRYARGIADILSCSWDGPHGPDMETALRGAAKLGRGGKGCLVFAASGNESRKVNYPANSRQVIAVGASTDGRKRASYSNYGRSLSIVAPSNGGKKDIFTTDLSFRHRGYNAGMATRGGTRGTFCNDFGGTSSSTPLAAGVAALVLSVNPTLSRNEVRDILEQTADKIGGKRSYKKNGHSNSFGFGQVNAAKAVAMAKKSAR